MKTVLWVRPLLTRDPGLSVGSTVPCQRCQPGHPYTSLFEWSSCNYGNKCQQIRACSYGNKLSANRHGGLVAMATSANRHRGLVAMATSANRHRACSMPQHTCSCRPGLTCALL